MVALRQTAGALHRKPAITRRCAIRDTFQGHPIDARSRYSTVTNCSAGAAS